MMELDDTDRKILRVVQTEANLPLEEIGARVGLSRNACWRRIRTMETEGIITRRVALVDPDAVHCPLSVFLQIRAARHDADWARRFSDTTRDLPQILGVYRMTGDQDYLIRAQVRDMADYDRLYQILISRVDMARISASFVMEKIKDTTALPV
ncbi:MAG: Lrp/AsnC family transcriptional regulator [Rhodobacteraceae bacterium]|nr:Lrp/AsnC family transcriptional regulator [Paracoccaceae bacterium]